MKKLLLVPIFALTGCAHFGTEMAQISKAIANDPASFTINLGLTTPWGSQTVKMTRVGGSTNSVIVSPDGVIQINPSAAPLTGQAQVIDLMSKSFSAGANSVANPAVKP